MVIKKAELRSIAVREDQYPPADLPEIAFAGRSNVGKSTLLNYLTGRRKLARVSGSPGKTRTINFYEINDSIRIVDLPGYGYAKASRSLTEGWGKMMEDYLGKRKNLVCVVQLVDSRHDPTIQDIQMYEYLKYYNLHGIVAATKSDKISRNERQKSGSRIRKTLGMEPDDKLIFVSSLKKTGGDELSDELERIAEEYAASGGSPRTY